MHKSSLRIIFVAVAAALIAGCGFTQSAPKADSSAGSVTVSLSGASAKPGGGPGVLESATIQSISLEISASDMATITTTIPIGTLETTINVPAGGERTFIATVTIADLPFTGSIIQDIAAGSSTTVTIDIPIDGTTYAVYTVAGTASGLSGSGLVLQDNSGDDLTVSSNGTFRFSTFRNSGYNYSVSVLTQPSSPNQTCAVTNTTGTIIAGPDLESVTVTCTTVQYAVGGSVSGLTGGTLVLQNNSGDDLSVTADGTFNFSTSIDDGSAYSVTVSSQPAGQTCTVSNGSGTMSGAAVTNVSVACVVGTLYTIGGTISGATGTLDLDMDNGTTTDVLSAISNGAFTFPTAQVDGITYSVTASAPSGQSCTVTNGGGTISGANVTDVSIICVTTDTTPPTVTLLSPTSGATGIALNSSISATFSEAINASTVTTTTFSLAKTAGGAVTGAVAMNGGNTIATFTPSADLENGTDYTATLTTAITDVAGNAFAGTAWNFTTVALTVGPLYSAAPNWNDYVRSSATTTACDGTETGGYSACIHGGEKLAVSVTGISSCTGLAATDTLGAFDWTCDSSTNPVKMVSTGLKSGKNLSDLLDFAVPGWLNNSVTVTGTGAGLPFTTAAAAWWSNTITAADSGGSLTTAGTVYVVTANPSVVYTIDASKVALVVEPGVTLTGSATAGENIIYAASQNFLWIEGTIDATGDDTGVNWATVNFSVLRDLSASNASSGSFLSGVRLYSSSNNSLSNITGSDNGSTGVYLVVNSNDNSLSNITAANNGSNGVMLQSSSSDNSLSNITAANNSVFGIYLTGSSNNSLSNITAANNLNGIYLYSFSNSNSLSNITAVNNGQSGILLITSSNNNSLSNVIAANNGIYGVLLQSSSNNNSLSNITAANNGNTGVILNGSSNNSLSNITFANNYYGIYLYISSNNYFTGLLKAGNNPTSDCYVLAGTNPGLTNTSCAVSGSSDFTLTTGVTLASSFVGKVTTDDTANTSDANGTATFPTILSSFDWTTFENRYRGWGNDGSAFPNADNRAQWTTGTGRIWDWSAANGDTGDSGSPVIQSVLTVPDGNATVTHTWSDASTITYLRDAVEIMDDSIGNDNGLCESGETCLYTPNIGSYQGHGTLQSAGAFTDGTITGVTLMQYPTNGY